MKRAMGFLLSVALLIGTLSGILVMPTAAQEAVSTVAVGDGDYNGDGNVNMYDYMAVAQFVNGSTTLTAAQKEHMDVFADGVVDVYDAICLFYYINKETDVLGGEVRSDDGVYAQFHLENAVYTQTVAVGEIVEMKLTASAVSSLLAMEMHLSYDNKTLRFLEADSVSANAAPVSSSGGELWITKYWDEPVSLADGDGITTLRFEVLSPIMTSTTVSASSVKAVSVQAIDGWYTQKSVCESGAVVVDTSVTTTTTAARNYVTYTIETVAHEGTVAAGETMELDITASAVSDFNGMQLNLCFDEEQWEWVEGVFVGTVASFSYKNVNTAPLHPMTDKGEVWLTAMAMKGYALAENEVIATVTLKAKQDVTADSVIGACYSQASSLDGTMNGYVPMSAWVDGGVKIVKKTYTGPLGDYFYQNNVRLNAYQLVEHNGDFYFVGDYNKLAKNTSVYLGESFVSGYTYCDGTPLSVGAYDFDENGKMVIKNGVVGNYFYCNNTRLNAYQLVEYEGDFYFINDANKVAKNTKVYLSEKFVSGHAYADGTPLSAGAYDFDENGKMIIRNGVVGDYFYRDNTMLKAYQLVEYEGDFYFINDANKVAKNTKVHLSEKFVSGHTYEDGTPLSAGAYDFDENGKMTIRNGVVGDYLYRDNTMLKAYQLVEYEGDFYFINDANKVAKNTKVYLSEKFVSGHVYADGTPLSVGSYDFDENGKMIIRNGVVGDYFYRNNTMLKAYQLVEYEGDFYFINDANKVAKNTKVHLSEKFVSGHVYADGTPMNAGAYDFDENGKMIIKNGVVGDYFYRNNTMLKAYQLVEYEGDFYFINDGNTVVKNTAVYLTERFVDGVFTKEGYPLFAGKYTFDENGKLIY